MRASSVLMALFATLAVAVPSNLDSVNLPSLLESRQCAKAGTCSKGGDKGESCSALKCCSNSKSGRGGQVLPPLLLLPQLLIKREEGNEILIRFIT